MRDLSYKVSMTHSWWRILGNTVEKTGEKEENETNIRCTGIIAHHQEMFYLSYIPHQLLKKNGVTLTEETDVHKITKWHE